MSTTEEQITPAEHAELVRDANALVNVVETGITRTGLVFVTASALTVGALLLDQHTAGAVVAVVAAGALILAVILVVTRILLGDPPQPPTGVSRSATEVAQVAERPATGSGSATAENRRILRK